MTMPTLTLEVGFLAGASTGTYLTLDDAARGLLDTGTLAPDSLWTDLAAAVPVFSVQIRRGSSRVDGPVVRYEAGTLTADLDNSDRRLDPTNLSGPYVSAGVTQVTPMRAVRVRATWAGVTYDVWRGFADGWQISYDPPLDSRVTLTATDAFKVFAAYERRAVAPVGAGEDSGARADRILDSVGWASTDRIVATGDSDLQATTLDGDALTELQLAADSELGECYVDGAGRVVFRNRHALYIDARSNTSQATFGDSGSELPYEAVTPDYDDTSLANLIQVARSGGADQTASDTASRSLYLTHTYNRSDLALATDADAAQYATFLLHQSKDPELRFSTLTLNALDDTADLFPQILGREIGDRITIRRRPPGGGTTIERDVFIRGIQHDINDQSWRTTWTLQAASRFSFLTLDNTVLGLLDTNALVY
jgi:hypothetical protein